MLSWVCDTSANFVERETNNYDEPCECQIKFLFDNGICKEITCQAPVLIFDEEINDCICDENNFFEYDEEEEECINISNIVSLGVLYRYYSLKNVEGNQIISIKMKNVSAKTVMKRLKSNVLKVRFLFSLFINIKIYFFH